MMCFLQIYVYENMKEMFYGTQTTLSCNNGVYRHMTFRFLHSINKQISYVFVVPFPFWIPKRQICVSQNIV